MSLTAVIRIRGGISAKKDTKIAMKQTGLDKINTCVLISQEQNAGVLSKIKDYTTYGPINPEVLEKLIEKRGRLPGNKKISDEYTKNLGFKGIKDYASKVFEGKATLKDLGLKKAFRLSPPSKGHERKGVKKTFKVGGALGNRGEEINTLLKKMI